MVEAPTFGQMIRQNRLNKGLSLRKAAERGGLMWDGRRAGRYVITYSGLLRLEKDQREPSLHTLIAVCRAVGAKITIDSEGVVVEEDI